MARIRSVKPAFFKSASVASLPSLGTRLTWIGLWTYCDDEGRGVDDARLVKAEVWPLDDSYSAKKVEADLEAIATPHGDEQMLCRYVVNGRRYFHCVNWTKHQRVSHAKGSELPACPVHDGPDDSGNERQDSGPPPEPLANDSGAAREPSGSFLAGSGIGNREVEVEVEPGSSPAVADDGRSVAPTPAVTGQWPRNQTHQLAHVFADLVEKNGAKRPNPGSQPCLTVMSNLITENGFSDAERVIHWALTNDFWSRRIVNASDLRRNWEKLKLQSEPAPAKAMATRGGSAIDEYERRNGLR